MGAPARPLVAQAPNVDAAVRLAARSASLGAPQGLPAVRLGPLPGVSVDPAGGLLPVSPDGRLRVLVQGDGALAAVRAAGGTISATAGDVVAALIEAAAVDRVASAPGVRWVGAAQTLTTQSPVPRRASSFALGPAGLLDVSEDDTRVRTLRQRIGQRFEGVAGQGVIVGIVDSGLDLDHPDFLRPDGSTRVLYAWDQTDPLGPPPGRVGDAGFITGSECDGAVIDSGACRMDDSRGHGTHVLGIAAGDGSATGNGLPAFRYVGVAPEADLIAVKGGDAAFTSDGVVAGVSYVFERAAELGRPAVVIIALGSQAGPHDGTTTFERALDALVGPGRVAVVTAGNQGAHENESPDFPTGPIHFTGAPAEGEAVDHTLLIPPYTPTPGVANDAALLELWYEGDANLAITVTPPGQAPVRVASGDTVAVATPAGWVFVDNASTGPAATNGDKQALVLLFDGQEGEEPAEGEWGVRIETEPAPISIPLPYHGWIVGSTFQGALATPRIGAGATNSHSVTTPGNGDRMITVGAHATRHDWPVAGGTETFAFREPLGDVAFFSGPGPRRDGVVRPDVTAPGKVVVSAYRPGGTDFAALPSLVEADGAHAALLGTSMATPQVAGVVALLLQLRPDLSPEQIRNLLRGSAREDGFVVAAGGAPNDAFGFGKLDGLAAARGLGLPGGRLTAAAAPAARPLAVAEGRAGEVLPLLALALSAAPQEPVLLSELRVDVFGADPAAELVLVLDENRNGEVDAGEEELVAVPAAGAGAAAGDLGGALVVPGGRALDALVALRLGGGTPNGARIAATLPVGGLGAEGVLSAATDALDGPTSAVSSPSYRIDLLAEEEEVALSANPVRTDRLVVNYSERPRSVAIFSAAGRRVRALDPQPDPGPGRLEWDLRDDDGRPVANGAYFLFVDLPGGPVRRTVYVLRP
ncbi:MAG: S8 family serine peptidase [Gemmatimonadota bacterium]